MTSDVTVEEIPVSGPDAGPYGIVAGPDGALWLTLWFTEFQGHRIGRITVEGTITEYDLPHPGSEPHGLTRGPDGAVWAALEAGALARLTLDGHRP